MNQATTRSEEERKNVTVLYADISGLTSLDRVHPTGFTALSEKLGHEEINSLFKVLTEIVYNYEGTLNKFIDNRLMVFFGAAISHEDDSERAIYAGFEMMNALDQFNEEHSTNFCLHIGINSGVVQVSILDSNYIIKGDAVNLAEQLMKRAKHDILVSESIYKNAAHIFKMRVLKQVRKKGKPAGITPYQVTGIKEKPGHKHGIAGFSSPLVGRHKEFKSIKLALAKVTKGKSVVVTINGEAGVGKSRLIEEFKKITGDKVNWLKGRCLSYGRGFPFWVFLEQIRSYLGISDFDLELELGKKLGAKTKNLFKDRMNEYLPYLSVFLSIKVLEHLQEKVKYLNPESLRLQEFVSVKALFRDISKNKPLILYFEDIHWIDPESLELIKFLVDGLKDASIFFLFEIRPKKETGIYKIRESIQKISKKRYTEVTLKTLNTRDSKALIQNLLNMSGPPRDVLSLILEKSEGNPFYIEEIIRSFIESSILKKDNGSWFLTKDISSFKIPDTVEAVIRSRIDRLPIEAKEVLSRASVIGKTFLFKILSSIDGKNNLRKNLDFLEDKEFILKKRDFSTTSRVSPDTEYMFRHILIRDVVYKGMLKKKRKEIHKKIARWAEHLFRGKMVDYYEMLAYHYYHAESFKKAYDYYRKAGDEAKHSYQNNIAIDCYSKAIEIHKKLFPDTKKENLAELFEKRGDIREVKAEYDNAIKDYENAFCHCTSTEKKAGMKRKTGNIFFKKGEYAKVISFYDEVKSILKNIPASPVLLDTYIDYAFLLSEGKGDYSRAKKMMEHTFKKIDKKREKEIYARSSDILGGILRHTENYDEALKCRQRALVIYEELSDKRAISTVSGNIGIVYNEKGEFDTALKYHKKNLTISEEIGNKWGISRACCNMGLAYRNKGEIDIALKYHKRDLAISEEIGDKKGISVVCGNIGTIYYDKGELDTALRYFKRALAISEAIGDKEGIGVVSDNIGTIYYDKGKLDIALRYLKKDLAISEEIGDKNGIGIACSGIGGVYIEIKRFDDAKEYLKKSEQILKQLGERVYLSETFTLLSELNTVQEKYESAFRFAEKALSLAKETGARLQEVFALRAFAKAFSKEDTKKAIAYFKRSISLAKKHKMRLETARSLYEFAKILKNTGKKREAEKHIKEAKKIFEKSGAHRWLKKVMKLMHS